MPSLKPAYLALIPALALLAAMWLGRTQLAELAITSSMRHFGMENIALEIEHLGTGSSSLSTLRLTLPTAAGLYRLQAEDIRINYSLEQLSKANADSMVVERLLVHHEPAEADLTDPEPIPKALEPVKLIAALRHALREYLVINEFAVDHLSLSGDAFSILDGKVLRLHAINNDSIVSTKLSLHGQTPKQGDQGVRQLRISKLSSDQFQAELRFPEAANRRPAGVNLNIHDANIEGDFFADPLLLKEWLQPFVRVNHVEGLRRVTGTMSVDFSSRAAFYSTIKARSDRASFDAYQMDNLELLLNAVIADTTQPELVKIVSDSYVQFSKFEHNALSLADTQLYLTGEISLKSGSPRYSGSLSADSTIINFQSRSIHVEDIVAIVKGGKKDLKLRGNFSLTKVPGDFSYSLEHNLLNEFGRLVVGSSGPIDLNPDEVRLSQIWSPWPYPFDLLNGRIKLSSDLSWSKSSSTAMYTRIGIENAGGHYGEIVFSGLTLDHKLAMLPELHSVRPARVTLAQLDSGVIASNISTILSLDKTTTGPLPRIVARQLHGEIFDGSFSGDDIVFDLNGDSNRFEIAAEDIDLAAVVATQQLEDIEVTGRIDGTIPVSINAQGIFIEHGVFINDVRSGTIRYNPATGTEQLKQNPITGIALDALRDFRYSHLSADVNFTPDGMLSVSLQLKGTSPELDTRRPVHLNINTEQNLLSLLKSLRYAESLGASIDQRVRDKYKKTARDNQENQ